MRSYEWIRIHYDWCGHRYTQRMGLCEDTGKRQPPEAKQRGNQASWHLDLRLPASRTLTDELCALPSTCACLKKNRSKGFNFLHSWHLLSVCFSFSMMKPAFLLKYWLRSKGMFHVWVDGIKNIFVFEKGWRRFAVCICANHHVFRFMSLSIEPSIVSTQQTGWVQKHSRL